MTAAVAESVLELSSQEQAIVLVVVLCSLALAALVSASVYNLARFAYLYVHEQRTLQQLARAHDVAALNAVLATTLASRSMGISQLFHTIAAKRLQHLEFVADATNCNVQLSMLSFDDDALVLSGLPSRAHANTNTSNGAATAKTPPMALADVLAMLEQLCSTGDSVMAELVLLAPRVPERWRPSLDVPAWLATLDVHMSTLHAHRTRVQHLSSHIADVLMDKLQAGDAIATAKLAPLLSALRTNDTPSTSNSSNASTRSNSNDELRFFVKAFDEIHEQEQVKRELRSTMQSYAAVAAATAVNTPLSSSDASLTDSLLHNGNGTAKTTHSGSDIGHEEDPTDSPCFSAELSPPPSPSPLSSEREREHEKARLARKLEQCVDRAEVLGVTHFEEVERAQDALERARREMFCAAVVNQDAKVLENVEALALNFVNMGARRPDAVLKAGEILANRSNTLLLVSSLRTMFDELRKQDVRKMDERRKRDAAKLVAKRQRLHEKFRLQQQLVVETRDAKRAAQQQRDLELRQQQQARDAAVLEQHLSKAREAFVWRVTKLDAVVVLLVMALVFIESLRQLAFLKPVCQPDTSAAPLASSRFTSWFVLGSASTSSLSTLACQVAYGAKMAALLLLLALGAFVLAQLQVLSVVLPMLLAFGLYHVRAEWVNMLLRVPLVSVIYAFNASSLYVWNCSTGALDTTSSTVGDARPRTPVAGHAKRWLVAAYVVFPLLSVALSVVVGIGIACDDPLTCASTAYRTLAPTVVRLLELLRHAYRV